MVKLKLFLYKLFRFLDHRCLKSYYSLKSKTLKIGLRGKGTYIGFPSFMAQPLLVYLYNNAVLQGHHKIINFTGKFIMKEYCVTSYNLVVVTGNHIPTVGIPVSLLASSHINDKETDVIMEEDVWLGINVTLLPGAHLGRGVVVGACSLVNKEIPPYAIVAGSPAKIIGVKFSIKQIIEHEKKLYPENRRFSHEYLLDLHEKYYTGIKPFGIDNSLGKEERQHLYDTMIKWNFSLLTDEISQ